MIDEQIQNPYGNCVLENSTVAKWLRRCGGKSFVPLFASLEHNTCRQHTGEP